MVNILKVDVDELNTEVKMKHYHSLLHLCIPSPQYCIMNEDTFELLKNEFEVSVGDVPETEDGRIGTFVGLEVAICNKLKLGEVDIK